MEVDLRTYRDDELESKVLQGHDYLGWAVKFGVVVYERDRFWSKFTARVANKVPLPSAQVARERVSRAHKHASELMKVHDHDATREQLVSVLTHLARAELITAGIYPASRPELPQQLTDIGHTRLAYLLSSAIKSSVSPTWLMQEVDMEIRHGVKA